MFVTGQNTAYYVLIYFELLNRFQNNYGLTKYGLKLPENRITRVNKTDRLFRLVGMGTTVSIATVSSSSTLAVASIPQTAGLTKCQTLPCLTVVLWRYQNLWEIQSPVAKDEVTGVHEYFCRIYKRKCINL